MNIFLIIHSQIVSTDHLNFIVLFKVFIFGPLQWILTALGPEHFKFIVLIVGDEFIEINNIDV